jgi:hypothetical protein
MRNSEQCGSRREMEPVLHELVTTIFGMRRRTLIQLKICYRLPLVGRDEPLVVFSPTAEVDNELRLVVVESLKDGLEAIHGEGRVGEQVRCDDDLLQSN